MKLFNLKFLAGGFLANLAFGLCLLNAAAWQQPPEQFTVSPIASQGTSGATDGNGNAIAVFVASGEPHASYYTNGSWGPVQDFGPGGVPSVAMDASGTGLMIYGDGIASVVKTAFFNGGNWSTPLPDPLDTLIGFSTRQAIAMNGLGQGVAIWNDSTLATIRSSFFSGGSWSIPSVIGAGVAPLPRSIAYSSDGTAAALWTDGSTLVANNYIGSWQGAVILGNSDDNVSVGIDSNGNAIAVWLDLGSVVSATFNGSIWLPSQIISAGPGNSGISLAVAPGGTAVLVWRNSAGDGLSSSYNGSSWGAIQQFGSNLVFDFGVAPGVSVDSAGNALVVYGAPGQILSASLPLNGVWEAPLIIKDPANGPNTGSPYYSALSSGGRGFAFWTELILDEERPLSFASALIPDPLAPLPPSNFQGASCKNRFATQTDFVNILTWTPSLDPSVVAYYLRRNGMLIASIPPAGPYVYYDHYRNRPVVYSLSSLNGLGFESLPVIFEFPK